MTDTWDQGGVERNIALRSGDSRRLTFTVSQGGVPYVWTGKTVDAPISDADGTEVGEWEITTAPGLLELYASAELTAELGEALLYHRVTVTEGDEVLTWIAGTFEVMRQADPAVDPVDEISFTLAPVTGGTITVTGGPGATALNAHAIDTTNVHGIVDTAQLATLANVFAAIDALIGGAPGALNTLDELAAALADDASFSATLLTAIGAKINTSALAADGDILTRIAGVPGGITRANLAEALAPLTAFSSRYVSQATLTTDGDLFTRSGGVVTRISRADLATALSVLPATTVQPSGDVTGVTDTAAIIAAVTSVTATGGIVYLARGTFYIRRSIVLPSNVTLEGAGRTATIVTRPATQKTLLTVNAAANATSVTVADGSIFSIGQGIHLWDTTNWDGWTATTATVTNVVGNVVTFDTPLWGALQTARAATATTTHPMVRNVDNAVNIRVRGIKFDQAKGANDPPLVGITQIDYTYAIIHFEQAFGAVVEDCWLENAAGDAYSDQGFNGAGSTTISGTNLKRCKNVFQRNRVTNAVRHATHEGTGVEGFYILNNEMTSCQGGYGLFYCAYATHGVASGNIVYDCLSGFAGIDGRDFGNTIADNIILDCRAGGYAIEAASATAAVGAPPGRCTISGNVIRGRGILINNPEFRLIGNIIDLNDGGFIGFEMRASSDRSLVQGNLVSNGSTASYGAILSAGADDLRIMGNHFVDLGQGVSVNGVNRLVAKGNHFSTMNSAIGWNFESTVNTDCVIGDEMNVLTNPKSADASCVRLVYEGIGTNGANDPASGGDWNAATGVRHNGRLVRWNSGGGERVSIYFQGVGWTALN